MAAHPIRFGLIGGGWRSRFYLRIARELPERFQATGVMVREPEGKGRRVQDEWGVPVVGSVDGLLPAKPAFIVVSVPWSATPHYLRLLHARGIPALSETPPAPNLDGLIALNGLVKEGARIQVAEQYPFQPLHAARIALVQSGLMGAVSQAQVSVAHGYHGIALMRKLMGVGFEEATITARRVESPLIAGPDRGGPPPEETLETATQTLAWLDFKERLGVFDFTGSQYFSWIRSPRLLVRGERGEINGTTFRFLGDYRTPVTLELKRVDAGQDGNLEGYYHKGIMAGSDWVYRNPFAPGRLSDEEIAVATCLQKMAEYVEGGPPFYSLADASQDHYLSMMMDRAASEMRPVRAVRQVWSREGV